MKPTLRMALGLAQCLLLALLAPLIAFADELQPVSSEPPSPELVGLASHEKIAQIDKELFQQLAELAKFNIHFHLEANHHQKWRALTYPLARESGTALSFAATLIDINQQAQGIRNPKLISRNELKKAVTCGITGNALSGSASALELAQNTWVMIKSRQKGYSPKRSIEFVKNIVAKTDRLLELRERFTVDEPSDQRRRIITLETKLVRRIRQQLLFEFATWSCHSRDQAWRENSFYTLDSLQSYGRMSAGIMTMRAFERPQIARYAVITALASNAVATINPILDNLAAIYIRKHQERKIASQIPIERPTTAPPDLEQLQQELANDGHPGGHQDWLRRVAALNLRTEKVDVALDRETKDIERYRQIAQQQTFSGPLIGLTGVASSTLATVAVYGYPRDIRTATRLGLAGRITQGTGQAYALVYTPYTIFSGMLRNHRLRKRHELPTQLLQERLARLEKIQIQ